MSNWNDLDSSSSSSDLRSLLTTAAARFLLQQPGRIHPFNDADDDGSKEEDDDEEERKWSWTSFKFIVSLAGVILFNGTIIFGNSLVILAVFTHSKLRPTTTNKFIVSLAVADLLVGIAVLPFSSANQMLGSWPFGRIWCRMWLAVDVWLCTASILNLCAISVDRYLAISRPFKYPQLMSPSRAKLLIIAVWILSFIICFPPLLGWEDPAAVAYGNASPSSSSSLFHDDGATSSSSPEKVIEVKGIWQKSAELFDQKDEYEHLSMAPAAAAAAAPTYSTHHLLGSSAPPSNSSAIIGRTATNGGMRRMQCTLTSEPGYIIYSSCGSFWVPMLLMLVFYWKIYKTATSATAAFRRGFIEKKSVLSKTNSSSQGNQQQPNNSSLTLRVHRGSRITMRHSNGCISELLPPVTAVSLQLTRRSFDSQLAARNIPVPQILSPKAATDVVPLKVVEPKALPPKIVVTASPSAGEEARQAKDGEEGSRGKNYDRKSSIFSVDDEGNVKGEENNIGRNERKSCLLSAHEERKEKEDRSGRKSRKSSRFSMRMKVGKWIEGEDRKERRPSILALQEERKEREEESGRSERKSSRFSMRMKVGKWIEGEGRKERRPSILAMKEKEKEKETETEEESGRDERKSSIFSLKERKLIEGEYRKGRRPSQLSTKEERKEEAEKIGIRNERKSSIFSIDEDKIWIEKVNRSGRRTSMLSTHEERKENEEKSGRNERKSSIFSIDEDKIWKEKVDRSGGRKLSTLSTAAEEGNSKDGEEDTKERKSSILSTEGVKGYGSVDTSRKNSFLDETDESGTEKRSSLISVRLSKLNFIAQLRSLNREKKAAKTVGIIVGCFIICWAPFFTVYLLGAFCRGCTPAMLFHAFFWLGYCNSAINPFVYGLCSKEFRYAFQKLLRCRCEQRRDDLSLSLNHQSTSVRSVSRLQSVLQSFKLQIATRSTSTTNTSPAFVTEDIAAIDV